MAHTVLLLLGLALMGSALAVNDVLPIAGWVTAGTAVAAAIIGAFL
ncbi:hypothetical protein [Candidatus Leptofilum sp.]